MKQFILSEAPARDNIIRLEGKDYHYLIRVRRLAAGEFFPAILPSGKETLIQILSVDKNVLTGKCRSSIEAASVETASVENAPDSAASSVLKLPSIVLFQALPKGDKMDLIVRQAAEGGIAEIVPFVSEFSIAKTGADGQKFSRWERIIREARQQSGSKIATSIRRLVPGNSCSAKPDCPTKPDYPTKLNFTINGLFNYWAKLKEKGAIGLLFHQPNPKSAALAIRDSPLENESLHSYLDRVSSVVVMAVGPEGGFSDSEAELFLENGFKPVTIGDAVLRTETAALYCAAAVKIILLERDSWELKKVKKNSG